jgi:flavoprotein
LESIVFIHTKLCGEAYGKSNFNPLIFEGKWQANQSLHAYIPVKSIEEAKRIQKELCNKDIENYLLSLKMEGTMSWAQPGKIKKFIEYQVDFVVEP